MSSSRAFGEKLRLAREGRGLSLEAIAHSTKIGAPLLASLERGDCSRWPTGVYSRAYVRTFAQAVGLDAKETAEEFCDCFPTVAWPEGSPTTNNTGRQSPLDLTQYDFPDEPLRLTLDPMPSPRWGMLKSRFTMRLAECGAGILVAAAVSLVGVDFWMALSATSLAVQARHLP